LISQDLLLRQSIWEVPQVDLHSRTEDTMQGIWSFFFF
jgi:hypothetical protein